MPGKFSCSSFPSPILLGRLLVRLSLFSVLWCVLAGLDGRSWIIGLPAVSAATFCSLLFAPQQPCPVSFLGVLRFIPFFVNLSFWGGCDVMRRALSPAMPINPGLVRYQVSLPEVPQQVLLVNCISLLPGTISADFTDQCITIHTIDRDMPVWSTVHLLERRVAALFGIRVAGGRP
ncbi:MAG: Na+/H+ antiporter subunit E [Proteobacteria bacterium]|nr:Na+/H+ antiporter subunit E [Pseudomonadota bacterium]